MDNNEFYLLNKKEPKIITFYIILLIILSVLSSILIFYKFPIYKDVIGIVEDKNILKITLKEDLLTKFLDSKIYVDTKNTSYQIIEISPEYMLDEKYNKYYQIIVSIPLIEKYNIKNNLINLKLELPHQNLLDKIKEIFRKELEWLN